VFSARSWVERPLDGRAAARSVTRRASTRPGEARPPSVDPPFSRRDAQRPKVQDRTRAIQPGWRPGSTYHSRPETGFPSCGSVDRRLVAGGGSGPNYGGSRRRGRRDARGPAARGLPPCSNAQRAPPCARIEPQPGLRADACGEAARACDADRRNDPGSVGPLALLRRRERAGGRRPARPARRPGTRAGRGTRLAQRHLPSPPGPLRAADRCATPLGAESRDRRRRGEDRDHRRRRRSVASLLQSHWIHLSTRFPEGEHAVHDAEGHRRASIRAPRDHL
jgi:hypothetical protein